MPGTNNLQASDAEAYTIGEDHIAECPDCGYRERNFESLADARASAERHQCPEVLRMAGHLVAELGDGSNQTTERR